MRTAGPSPREVRALGFTASGQGLSRRFERLGYSVQHCGHPTALWPWYGIRPDGSYILSPSGRAFRLLRDALEATAGEIGSDRRSERSA